MHDSDGFNDNNDLPRFEIDNDGWDLMQDLARGSECWNINQCKFSNRCGMCPACYGWTYDFELEGYKFYSPVKKKSFRLWG